MYAFAMALGVTPESLIDRIGHDGGERLWHLPEPRCRRGFHPQELIHAFPEIGTFTLVERGPCLIPTTGCGFYRLPWDQVWSRTLQKERGVVEGVTHLGGRHAMAFERGKFFDPDTGSEYLLSMALFEPELAWVLHEGI